MNLVKSITATVALTMSVSASAFAGSQTITIPASKLGEYKAAVKLAMQKANLTCEMKFQKTFPVNGTVLDVIHYAPVLTLNRGAQPLLVFANYGNFGAYEVSVMTTPDLKEVTSVVFKVKERVKVTTNKGDLANPSVVTEEVWVDMNLQECK